MPEVDLRVVPTILHTQVAPSKLTRSGLWSPYSASLLTDHCIGAASPTAEPDLARRAYSTSSIDMSASASASSSSSDVFSHFKSRRNGPNHKYHHPDGSTTCDPVREPLWFSNADNPIFTSHAKDQKSFMKAAETWCKEVTGDPKGPALPTMYPVDGEGPLDCLAIDKKHHAKCSDKSAPKDAFVFQVRRSPNQDGCGEMKSSYPLAYDMCKANWKAISTQCKLFGHVTM